MITYSINMMGPWHTSWYTERGLTHKATRTVTTNTLKGYSPGDTVEYDEIDTYYACGRIDIWGDPCATEYGIAVMHGEDWNAFSDWLDDFESEELVSYDSLIDQFETQYKNKIRWWND